MPWTAEGRRKGGLATYKRHGADHYRRITNGRPRRERYTPKGRPGSPLPPLVNSPSEQR